MTAPFYLPKTTAHPTRDHIVATPSPRIRNNDGQGRQPTRGACLTVEQVAAALGLSRQRVQQLGNLLVVNSPRFGAMAEILEAVATVYGVSTATIVGRCRSKSIAEARQVACLIARRCTRLSLPEIGRAVGRDHTTVMHAVTAAAQKAAADRWLGAAVDELLTTFGAAEERRVQ